MPSPLTLLAGHLDVTDSDEMSRRVGDSRKRSVNVSNAGILLTGYFEDIEARTHHKEIDINTKRRRRAKKMRLVVGSSAFRDELGCFAGRSVPNVFAKGLDGTLVRRRGRRHAVGIVGARLAISGALRAPAVSFVRRGRLCICCANCRSCLRAGR